MYNTALKVLSILYDNGFDAYIVGGYPRDLYMGKVSIDIDICSNAKPVDIKNIFPKFKVLNEQYGAVIVDVDNYSFEITTFREEIKYNNNRIPSEFNYVDSLEKDIIRRDFTINTICIDKNENTVDLLNGREDIDLKIIRAVGNADKKLKEDSLRILRAIRFATTLDFKLDSDLKEAIKNNGHLLKGLSYYRKKQELDKIFASPNAKIGLSLIKELNLDSYLELSNIDKVVITDLGIGIWAQVDAPLKYEFSNIEKSYIKKINEILKNGTNDFALYKYGLFIGEIAFSIAGFTKEEVSNRYDNLPIIRRSDIVLKANEICAILNKRQGSFLNDIYDDLELKIINHELNNDKEELTRYVMNNY